MQQGPGSFNKVVGIKCGNYHTTSSIAPWMLCECWGKNASFEKVVTESPTLHSCHSGFAQLYNIS